MLIWRVGNILTYVWFVGSNTVTVMWLLVVTVGISPLWLLPSMFEQSFLHNPSMLLGYFLSYSASYIFCLYFPLADSLSY